MPKIIELREDNIEVVVREAAAVLNRGGLILYPTDTIYGLGVDATNESALNTLYMVKERDPNKPMSCVVDTLEDASAYVHITPLARELAQKYLPGALTIVLEKKENTPHYMGSPNGELSIRIPNHPFCQTLAHLFKKPYTATSANKSGMETRDTISQILEQFDERAQYISLCIDAGLLLNKTPSTVVDARTDAPLVLRNGAIVLP